MKKKNSSQKSEVRSQKSEKFVLCSLFSVLCFLFLASCATPPVKKEAVKEKETILSLKEIEEGKATPEEEILALKGKDIPLVKKEGLKEIKKVLTEEEKRIFKNIYFDLDKSDIKPESRNILEKIANYLLKNSELDLLIEGHCDERGTSAYNLALGERRALSARRYLVGLGMASKRLQTISYGEEKPADAGHNEAAWAKNRRDEFKILQ